MPIIIPNGGPTEEYLSDNVVFLENSDIFIAPPHNTRYRIFDYQEIANAINTSISREKTPKNNSIKKQKFIDNERVIQEWITMFK